MNKTVGEILSLLIDATSPQYSPEVSSRKVAFAQTLALIAIVEQLERANDLKEKEFRMKGLEE